MYVDKNRHCVSLCYEYFNLFSARVLILNGSIFNQLQTKTVKNVLVLFEVAKKFLYLYLSYRLI